MVSCVQFRQYEPLLGLLEGSKIPGSAYAICQLGFFEDMVPQNQICHNLPMTMTITGTVFGIPHVWTQPYRSKAWRQVFVKLSQDGAEDDWPESG